MGKFRKKPVVIEAFLWTGDQYQQEDPDWIIAAMNDGTARIVNTPTLKMEIDTLGGTHTASPGDWIIQGVKGELYPCKPDIFDMTYEAVR